MIDILRCYLKYHVKMLNANNTLTEATVSTFVRIKAAIVNLRLPRQVSHFAATIFRHDIL